MPRAFAGQCLRDILVSLVRRRFIRAQGIEIGRGIERRELLAPRRVFVRQCLGPQPELARGRMQRFEPRINLGEPIWIEVEFLRVVIERVDRFLELDFGRLERRERIGETRVDFGERAQPRDQRAELMDHRVVGLGQRAERLLDAADQARGIRQAPVFGMDFFPFTGLRHELVEFGQLPGEPLAFELDFAVARGRRLDRGMRFAPHAPRAAGFGAQGREPRMRIEQFALRVGAHQQLVRMLAMDLDEHLADFAQLGQGGPRCR